MATDCSGLAVPELALQELAQQQQSEIRTVFACDIWSGSRKWLQHLHVQPVLADMVVRVWTPVTGKLLTKTCDGQPFVLTNVAADLDIYICGFMCTPFTPNGQRRAWQDENSKTFWATLRTILTLRPKCFVLENVCAIANNTNSEVVDQALARLTGYVIHKVKVDTKDFGIPQHRPRIYIIGWRTDVMRPAMAEASTDFRQQLIENKIKRCYIQGVDFRKFLASCGYPVEENKADAGQDAGCTCATTSTCHLHECQCKVCKQHGPAKRRCMWRKSQKLHMQSVRSMQKRRAYLALWRRVKQDRKLKAAPDYFELASKKSLNTAGVSTPLKRSALRSLSQLQNLMKPFSVLLLSKSLGRNAVRDDGMVPTLTHGCSALFVPSAAQVLTVPQLMCLTGLHPKAHKRCFQIEASMSTAEMDLLIANAMSLPVVGTVCAVALSMLGS